MIFRWLKKFLSGNSRLSRCWMGLHRWSMPGGWCERCGKCDLFFGRTGHILCERKCRHWEPPATE